jgi:hypothetical protein
MDRIVLRNGVPYVRTETTCSREPLRIIDYWPLPGATGRVEEGDMASYHGDGYYSVATRGEARWFRLPAGGATTTAERVEEPIAPPKTKFPVRWQNGRWEKQLKRGWVPA